MFQLKFVEIKLLRISSRAAPDFGVVPPGKVGLKYPIHIRVDIKIVLPNSRNHPTL